MTLSYHAAFSGFSVPDIGAAEKFYGETLGLSVTKTPQGLELALNGTKVFIYPSPANKPADFTVLNFVVDDIHVAMAALKEKGVALEHYDTPGLKTDEDGIARGPSGPAAMAWFKDPAGNIIGIMQE